MSDHPPSSRVLVAIPAYNEAPTIEAVVRCVRSAVPQFDLLVVNDGSSDDTAVVLEKMGVRVATHLCNLGYGRAIQTTVKYAAKAGYDVVMTLDADGQHDARDLEHLYEVFCTGGYDLLIGSRFVDRRTYRSEPLARRLGMNLFSQLISFVSGQRIYDTSSGLKVIGHRTFSVLMARPFVDFHAEAISYLIRSGYRVGESPISVGPREHGRSMYSALSAVKYPLKVSFLILLSVFETRRVRGRSDG